MSYRKVPRKAIRYTEATRTEPVPIRTTQRQAAKPDDLSQLTYRDLQQRAVLLGINGKQTREALTAAIEEAEA